ncbi:MAG: hypothetical protein N2202_08160 [Proteobacteria bacterium]|nr:hypothetical protein [Pseudomonadota bacterium]
MKRLFLLILFFTLLSCGVKLEPVVTSDVTLDKEKNALLSTKENITVTVQIAPQSYSFYGMEDTFAIFYVTIENGRDKEIYINPEDFVLFDDKMHQVNVIKVEDVAKIVEQNLFYLIPYPYIGYYSESLNYYEGRYLYNPSAPHIYPVSPREIYLDALPWGKIMPKAHVKGKIYFKKRVSEAKALELRALQRNNNYLFRFNFQVK